MNTWFRLTRGRVAILVVLAGLVSAAVAYAAIPDSNGVYTACMLNKVGTIRLIDKSLPATSLMSHCNSALETEVAWNKNGGSATEVTQNGTFTVPWGETGSGRTLPLTGVTVSGRCELTTGPQGGEVGLARVLFEAATGETMDAFVTNGFGINPQGQSSVLGTPIASGGGGFPVQSGTQTAIVTSNGATASITLGGFVDSGSRTCSYVWQAVETPN
jgi:hypothetical protein